MPSFMRLMSEISPLTRLSQLKLKHQFGTFAAFAERLDYLKDLGVTHIQLLPVLSYYFVNELQNGKRLDAYA